VRRLLAAAGACALATAAFAGGPLYTFDPDNRIPYAWVMSSWPNGQVPIYTDLGTLGILSNAQAGGLVAYAAEQWSSVPTSTFRGAIAGDFSDLGLGDVNYDTIDSVLGVYNGGGIDVIYDDDGGILADYFGVPPTSVLGITDIEYAAVNSPEITEAYMILSGPGVRAEDPDGVGFQGVVTHELGHALNLSHSQDNGAVREPSLLDPPQPAGCGAPWSGTPSAAQMETMYPFIIPTPTGSGPAMGTVDRTDDIAALSDLYPGPGWPQNFATIHGQILDTNGIPVTGVNVIARNVADPFGDTNSYISGQISKGGAGPDGSFELRGLTPGASYLVYVDELLAGGFSVPRLAVLPGPEEYYNGAHESGDGTIDDRCAYTPVSAPAGSPVTVNISFNSYPGAPTLITAPTQSFQTVPTDITPDGGIVVGGEGLINVPVFRWDVNANTIETLGGTFTGSVSISDDGTKISANIVDTDGINKAALFQNEVWTPLPPVPGAVACSASDSGLMYTSAYDISGDGSTVVGLSYGAQGCNTSTIRAFKWTAAGGTVALPKNDSPSRATRANAVNYDGSVIVGWDDLSNGQRRGAQWRNGVETLIKKSVFYVGEADGVSRNGSYIVGSLTSATSYNEWIWSQPSGVQLLGRINDDTVGGSIALNDDASVIVGQSLNLNTSVRTPTLWTSGLHLADLNQFLGAQGVNTAGLTILTGLATSADGRTITGYAANNGGYLGWVLKTPTSVVCHVQTNQTMTVSFPQGLNEHLGHGDTLGPCPCLDADGDGVTTCGGDCNDGNAAVHPGAVETCNGVDDDCNGTVDDVAVPASHPALTLANVAGNTQLSWDPVSGATGYDVFAGDLMELRAQGGNYASLTSAACMSDNLAGTTVSAGSDPGSRFFLVRPVNCGGAGSYDDTGLITSRDAGIQASPSACP
jgi:uncharacterized membrane protein